MFIPGNFIFQFYKIVIFQSFVWFQVRFQAVRAVTAFIMLHEKEAPIQKHFSDLLPNMVQVFKTL
jgi:hypothetical protein